MADNPGASKYVTLVSNDLFEFVVLREATYISPVIKRMVDPSSKFQEAQTGRCLFEDISGVTLEKLVEYFQYWYKCRDKDDVPDMEIPVEHCLEMLMAADFLNLDQ